jgi:hypothetical protein
MTVFAKDGYASYRGDQIEIEIFGLGDEALGLENMSTLKQFQVISKNLRFRSSVTGDEFESDPAARIRALIDMIKYVHEHQVRHFGPRLCCR